MKPYEHILVAVDFLPGSEDIGQRATELMKHYGARLSLIHVVEYLPVTLDNELIAPLSMDVEKQLVANAQRQLEEYAARVGLTECRRYVEMGSAKLEILRVAEEAGVDLIVVGRHGRHGLARLLGSTASAVLHTASCDVLAVKLGV